MLLLQVIAATIQVMPLPLTFTSRASSSSTIAFITTLDRLVTLTIASKNSFTCPHLHCTAVWSYIYFSFSISFNNFAHGSFFRVIRDWAANVGRGIGPLDHKLMECTRLADLQVNLGQPYLFLHQGDCEHLLVFTDIRMYNPMTDSTFIKDYPKFIATNKRLQIKCGLCNLNTAKLLTHGDQRLPHEPFFFCEPCFQTFCYDDEGNKVDTFRAYSYLDRTALL